MDIPSKRRRSCPFFPFLCQQIGCYLSALVSSDLFTQSTESNANVFQKHPSRHTKTCFTSYLGICEAGQVDTKNQPSLSGTAAQRACLCSTRCPPPVGQQRLPPGQAIDPGGGLKAARLLKPELRVTFITSASRCWSSNHKVTHLCGSRLTPLLERAKLI